jgi:hypothetical protein
MTIPETPPPALSPVISNDEDHEDPDSPIEDVVKQDRRINDFIS